MRHKLNTLPATTKPFFKLNTLKRTLLGIGILAASQQVKGAEQEWWFDVEVILFERSLESDDVLETFKQSSLAPKTANTLDLLTPYLTPDISYLIAGLPYCESSKQEEISKAEQQKYKFPNTEWVNSLSDALDELSFPDTNSEATITEALIPTQQSSQFTENATNTKVIDLTGEGEEEQESEAYVSQLTPMSYIEWQIPKQLPCAYAQQIEPKLVLNPANSNTYPQDLVPKVPVKINGIEWQTKMSAFLLPTDTFKMDQLYESIKYQRGITPLLHLAWRQQVSFGRENANAIRLFAGKNYGDTYMSNGKPLPQDTDALFDSLLAEDDITYVPESERLEQLNTLDTTKNLSADDSSTNLFAKIDEVLDDSVELNLTEFLTTMEAAAIDEEQSEAVKTDIWQIDGELAVYLRNIGRVPYLHIDSNLDYRHPIVTNTQLINLETANSLDDNHEQVEVLESVNFDQLRRVISKQIHYFDHPLFGMVVTINRYKWPEVETDEGSE
ncbi:CsiV family protein [Paraglaciecola sp. 2405UD69-4]|uniref:CsiV family protein n=1 Tax=Paraglaciecola sp. 2405UD69-4 TaxID=3391836 RepID=UPI0039C8DBAC